MDPRNYTTQVIFVWWSLHLELTRLTIMDDHIGSHSLAYLCDYCINVSLPEKHGDSMRVNTMSLSAYHCWQCLAQRRQIVVTQQLFGEKEEKGRKTCDSLLWLKSLFVFTTAYFPVQPLDVLLCYRIPQVLLVLKGFSPVILYSPGICITEVIPLISFNGTK